MTPPPVWPALRDKATALQRAGLLAPTAAHPPGSPCIAVCQLDVDQQYCIGCLRTLEELQQWGHADAATQRRIWHAILARAGL